MNSSWQFLVILAFLTVAVYTGFEIFNSVTGRNVEFNETITPIEADLGQDVLTHLRQTSQNIPYKGETDVDFFIPEEQ